MQIDDKILFINKRGNFSNIILGLEEIENVNYYFSN